MTTRALVQTFERKSAPAPSLGARLGAWVGTRVPEALRQLDRRLEERLAKAPLALNEFGYDPYGFSPAFARYAALPAALLYTRYFRVETHDIERVPPGGVLLVGNHAGQFAYDGAMLALAMLLEAEPPRVCRGMGEYFLWRVPWMGTTASRTGTLVGTPVNCVSMLRAGECVMVFPEGARGANKPFRQRYQLQPFGQGFMRLALETGVPIVPVGIVGSEEQQPGLANLIGVARLLNLPSFPITISQPWLGLLGPAVALPVKYRIHFGEPLRFEGSPDEEDAAVEERIELVRRSLADLIARGRRARRGVFR
jgi:1-acyl-sn-glycerol-3-phosphate acyltransferase